VPEFDIREYRARKGLPVRIENPDVIASVTALLRRDLTQRLADQRQSSQGRTAPGSARYTERADAETA
jgi:hypothetical protein